MKCLKVTLTLLCLCATLSMASTDRAEACRDYDGHRNSVVPPSCGGSSDVDAAIDAVGLPAVFHDIAYRESGDDPYAVNPYSGACGPFQFLPSTAADYGYTCADLTDPYTAARAALVLYQDYGLSPWTATVY